jgi:hypothetical protein
VVGGIAQQLRFRPASAARTVPVMSKVIIKNSLVKYIVIQLSTHVVYRIPDLPVLQLLFFSSFSGVCMTPKTVGLVHKHLFRYTLGLLVFDTVVLTVGNYMFEHASNDVQ